LLFLRGPSATYVQTEAIIWFAQNSWRADNDDNDDDDDHGLMMTTTTMTAKLQPTGCHCVP